jgi:hypothetical protein
MPALPWVHRESVDSDTSYTAMASRLPLKHYRSIPGFLRDTLAIRRQLAKTEGLVGYALDAQLAKKTFWTFSVWKTKGELDAFARSEPHNRIIKRLQPLMSETRFEFFFVRGEKLPMIWEQMKAPLD